MRKTNREKGYYILNRDKHIFLVLLIVTCTLVVIAAGAKAPRKQVGGSSSSSAASSLGSPTSSGKNKYVGGNPVRWWPSPKWQKGKYNIVLYYKLYYI